MSEEIQLEADFMIAYFALRQKHPDPDDIERRARETFEAWAEFLEKKVPA